ncbi:hypothetical protein Leryth_002828 [Lithospermum erythrorhizon]|nr:hypothetical protein Leryth_002828 [Lithospermum erythrorhizon]
MSPSRFLGGATPPTPPTTTPQETQTAVDSDFVVILAALLCALICILGLIAVARCAWLRRLSGGATTTTANKGVKKKVLNSLPKETYRNDDVLVECAICLMEFVEGDEMRLLPQCGHGFHVQCIDTWLGSHSSCPSCRQVLVVARCHKCGKFPAAEVAGPTSSTGREQQQQHEVSSFLP